MPTEEVATVALRELRDSGLDPSAWGMALARMLPTVLIVPAFGAGYLPIAVRLGIGVALAASIAVGMNGPPAALTPHAPWILALVTEGLRGVPVAVAAALSLWAAMVAGGLSETTLPLSSRRSRAATGPLSGLLGIAACVVFLETFGAERVAERLSSTLAPLGAIRGGVRDFTVGLDVGVSLAIPILVVALTVDIAVGLAERELPLRRALPTAAIRTLAVLVASSALFDSTLELLAVRAK